MLDYAANATLYLPIEASKERLAARCANLNRTMVEVLADHLGSDEDVDAFWTKMKDNLQANRIPHGLCGGQDPARAAEGR